MSEVQIKEIAEQLSLGFRAFIHKNTYRMLFIPEENNFFDMEMDAWAEESKELKKNASEYYKIERWSSREAFNMMVEFAEQLTDNPSLQSQVFSALNRRKPFREFKAVIDYSGDYREKWFAFKNSWERDYVKKQWDLLLRAGKVKNK
jgi:hypothetical protein